MKLEILQKELEILQKEKWEKNKHMLLKTNGLMKKSKK